MTRRLSWGAGRLSLDLEWAETVAPRWSAVELDGTRVALGGGLPVAEVLTVAHGHEPASDRLVHGWIGPRLRHAGHATSTDADGTARLVLDLAGAGLRVTQHLALPAAAAVVRAEVEVVNTGRASVVLRTVPSWSARIGGHLADWRLFTAHSDWLAENRWRTIPLDERAFPSLASELTGATPRGELRSVSTGTWSTGRRLPVGMLANPQAGLAWGWQIEHNGPWRFEVGQDPDGGYLALSGPTDDDHQWTRVLAPGESFRTVPVAVALAADASGIAAALTRYRRWLRRPHPDNTAMPVVFNDYMNTLMGDPTTAKLLPLISAAAEVGAEVFCVDAGWYDDGPWWDAVGAWEPARGRFPGGLGEVVDRIRANGMVAGLWLEPEVVGVRSPVADRLPDAAFLSRNGARVVEHDRFHLDLSHPAARGHLDAVVDRLVADFGIGYFKLDYNVNPGAGTDRDADSVGDGLLRHNRAHLAWLDGVLDRHQGLVLENCGSGAMRADPALLGRMQLQSTSDQQDFRRYPPIAASAPMAMLPEQAANWAYPQPDMDAEDVTFCLVTGLLGRFFLSGHLDRMDATRLALVTESVAIAKRLRTDIARSVPRWPLGLPGWADAWVALGLAVPGRTYLSLWNRDPEAGPVSLDPAVLAVGAGTTIRTLFPAQLPEWSAVPERNGLTVTNPTGRAGARLLVLEGPR